MNSFSGTIFLSSKKKMRGESESFISLGASVIVVADDHESGLVKLKFKPSNDRGIDLVFCEKTSYNVHLIRNCLTMISRGDFDMRLLAVMGCSESAQQALQALKVNVRHYLASMDLVLSA